MSQDSRRLLLFLVLLLPATALLFLYASEYFHEWDGSVVAVQSWDGEAPGRWIALVVEEDGDDFERAFPAEALRGHQLPAKDRLVPPARISDDAPRTRKLPRRLDYLVEDPEGQLQSFPTPTPGSLTLALFAGLVVLGLRNMRVSGSPLSIRYEPLRLPEALPPAGQPAKGPPRDRPRKGPPPQRKRKGRGRKR